jgi:hypothetical protein
MHIYGFGTHIAFTDVVTTDGGFEALWHIHRKFRIPGKDGSL